MFKLTHGYIYSDLWTKHHFNVIPKSKIPSKYFICKTLSFKYFHRTILATYISLPFSCHKKINLRCIKVMNPKKFIAMNICSYVCMCGQIVKVKMGYNIFIKQESIVLIENDFHFLELISEIALRQDAFKQIYVRTYIQTHLHR